MLQLRIILWEPPQEVLNTTLDFQCPGAGFRLFLWGIHLAECHLDKLIKGLLKLPPKKNGKVLWGSQILQKYSSQTVERASADFMDNVD